MNNIAHSTVVRIIFCLFTILFVSEAVSHHAYGGEAAIREIVVTNSSKEVLLYFKVINAFTPEMEKGIKNGIPVDFTFFVEIYGEREGGGDQEIAATTFSHTLIYDNLKEEFQLELFGRASRMVTTKSLVEAKQLMSQVNGVPVALLADLTPSKQYLLQVKAQLVEKTLPLYFHYLIPFWRLWEFETKWYDVKFKY